MIFQILMTALMACLRHFLTGLGGSIFTYGALMGSPDAAAAGIGTFATGLFASIVKNVRAKKIILKTESGPIYKTN